MLRTYAKHIRQINGENNMVQPRIVSGRFTVSSFSNCPEWDGSACTSEGRDKNFLGDTGERDIVRSLLREREGLLLSYGPFVSSFAFLRIQTCCDEKYLNKGPAWHAKRGIEATYFPQERHTYSSLFMKGFLLKYIAELTL